MADQTDHDLWNRRRSNLRALIAYQSKNPSGVSKSASLSVNTLGKFLRGETHTLSWQNLEKVCKVLGIPNSAILDSENPFCESKTRLYGLIETMSEREAENVLKMILETQKHGA